MTTLSPCREEDEDGSGIFLTGADVEHAKEMGLCDRCGETRTHVRVKSGLRWTSKLKPITSENPDGTYETYKGYCLGPNCYRLDQVKKIVAETEAKFSSKEKKRTKLDIPGQDDSCMTNETDETEETEPTIDEEEEETKYGASRKSKDLSLAITDEGHPVFPDPSCIALSMNQNNGSNRDKTVMEDCDVESCDSQSCKAREAENGPIDEEVVSMLLKEPSFRGKHLTVHMDYSAHELDSEMENSDEEEKKEATEDEHYAAQDVFRDFTPHHSPARNKSAHHRRNSSSNIFTIEEEQENPPPPPENAPPIVDPTNQDTALEEEEAEYEAQMAAIMARRSRMSKNKNFGQSSPAKNRYRAALRPTLPTEAGRHKVLNRNSVPSPEVSSKHFSADTESNPLHESPVDPSPTKSVKEQGNIQSPNTEDESALDKITRMLSQPDIDTAEPQPEAPAVVSPCGVLPSIANECSADEQSYEEDRYNVQNEHIILDDHSLPNVTVDEDESSRNIGPIDSEKESVGVATPVVKYSTPVDLDITPNETPKRNLTYGTSPVDLDVTPPATPFLVELEIAPKYEGRFEVASSSSEDKDVSPLSVNENPRIVVANGTRRRGDASRRSRSHSRSQSRSSGSVRCGDELSVSSCSTVSGITDVSRSYRAPHVVSSTSSADLTTDHVAASIIKKAKDSKTGISFKRGPNGAPFISKLSEGGLFSTTSLKVGHKVVTVNGINCENKEPLRVARLVRDAVGVVTIVAVRYFDEAKSNKNHHESQVVPRPKGGPAKASPHTTISKTASESGASRHSRTSSKNSNGSKNSGWSGGSLRSFLRKKKKSKSKNRKESDDGSRQGSVSGISTSNRSVSSRSVASEFTTTTRGVGETSSMGMSNSSSAGSSFFSCNDAAYKHATNSGMLWMTLVGQHVRFPATWFDGARSPHMGVTNLLNRKGEKVPQHRWAYIAKDTFFQEPILDQYVPDRKSPGRLLMHIVIRDEHWQPVQDVAIGCYHPYSNEITNEKGEDCRVVWMGIRKRSGHRVGSTALIDPILTSECRVQDIVMESPLGKGRRCRNKYLRVLFGDHPPVKTIFVLETELVKKVRAARTREYITDFRPITLLLLEMFLESRVEV